MLKRVVRMWSIQLQVIKNTVNTGISIVWTRVRLPSGPL